MSIDDIWDEPIVSPSRPAPQINSPSAASDSTNTLKRPRQALFLSDSDSEREREPPPKRATPAPPDPDIDALFANLDDADEGGKDGDGLEDLRYKPLAPTLDLGQLAREAEARHARGARSTGAIPALTPHQILPSSSPLRDGLGAEGGGGSGKGKGADAGGEGKKPRKKPAILDETRLVGPTGFPALIKDMKGFTPKGKGHEHTDLNRILQIYQFWTHRMYPKTTFKDTVNRVEKLCHSKRMQVRLSVWRDEAKGLVNGKKSGDDDDPDIIDLTEPTLVGTEDRSDAKVEDPSRTLRNSRSSPTPSLPPSSSEPEDDDFDIDAVIKAEEERQRLAASSTSAPASHSPVRKPAAQTSYRVDPNANEMDMDEAAMWADLDALDNTTPLPEPPQKPPPSSVSLDDDEEMWDIVNEMESARQAPKKPVIMEMPISSVIIPTPSEETDGSGTTSRASNDDDWDEMYL